MAAAAIYAALITCSRLVGPRIQVTEDDVIEAIRQRGFTRLERAG